MTARRDLRVTASRREPRWIACRSATMPCCRTLARLRYYVAELSGFWLCCPRFEAPAVFARLLIPMAATSRSSPPAISRWARRSPNQTMVLETTFQRSGTAVLTDAMAGGRDDRGHHLGAGSPGVLLRRLTCTAGEIDVDVAMRRGPNRDDPPDPGNGGRRHRRRGGASRLLLPRPPVSRWPGTPRPRSST